MGACVVGAAVVGAAVVGAEVVGACVVGAAVVGAAVVGAEVVGACVVGNVPNRARVEPCPPPVTSEMQLLGSSSWSNAFEVSWLGTPARAKMTPVPGGTFAIKLIAQVSYEAVDPWPNVNVWSLQVMVP